MPVVCPHSPKCILLSKHDIPQNMIISRCLTVWISNTQVPKDLGWYSRLPAYKTSSTTSASDGIGEVAAATNKDNTPRYVQVHCIFVIWLISVCIAHLSYPFFVVSHRLFLRFLLVLDTNRMRVTYIKLLLVLVTHS
jgi:hypothetical protein